jgi:DNA polymerase III alpha subunit
MTTRSRPPVVRRSVVTLALIATTIFMVAPPLVAQEGVTIATLLQFSDRYDGEVVTVAGVVAAYRERVSHSGEPYTVFTLRDARASVTVFAWPHQGLRNNLRVRVTGAFAHVKTYSFIRAQRTIVLRDVSQRK